MKDRKFERPFCKNGLTGNCGLFQKVWRSRCTLCIRHIIFVLVLSVGWSGYLFAAPDVVPLTTVEGYDPYTGAKLPHGGMVTEIVTTVFKNMGVEPVIKWRPRKRAYREASIGTVMGSFPWDPSPIYARNFFVSDPIINLDTEIYVDANSIINPIKPIDLNNLTLCVPLGHVPFGLIKELVRDGKLSTVSPPYMASCFKLLKVGRVDLISVSRMVAHKHAKSIYGFVDGIRPLKFGSSSTTQHILFSKHKPDAERLWRQFNSVLKKLRTEGVLEQIVTRHIWVR